MQYLTSLSLDGLTGLLLNLNKGLTYKTPQNKGITHNTPRKTISNFFFIHSFISLQYDSYVNTEK